MCPEISSKLDIFRGYCCRFGRRRDQSREMWRSRSRVHQGWDRRPRIAFRLAASRISADSASIFSMSKVCQATGRCCRGASMVRRKGRDSSGRGGAQESGRCDARRRCGSGSPWPFPGSRGWLQLSSSRHRGQAAITWSRRRWQTSHEFSSAPARAVSGRITGASISSSRSVASEALQRNRSGGSHPSRTSVSIHFLELRPDPTCCVPIHGANTWTWELAIWGLRAVRLVDGEIREVDLGTRIAWRNDRRRIHTHSARASYCSEVNPGHPDAGAKRRNHG